MALGNDEAEATSGPSGPWGAAFDLELSRLAEAGRDAFTPQGTADGPHGLSLVARAPGGYDVHVRRSADAVEIRLGDPPGWVHREALGDPPDDVLDAALDLVAAAMWGKILLREVRAGGKPWRITPIFSGAAGPRELSSAGGGILGWRPRTTTRERINHARPPEGVMPGEGGALPARPWIGVRGTESFDEPRALSLSGGELDLHPFSPKEVKPLVLEYIAACRAEGIVQLRIVHGKGVGHLRRTVHALLERHEHVVAFRLGGHGEGGWGATIVTLRGE